MDANTLDPATALAQARAAADDEQRSITRVSSAQVDTARCLAVTPVWTPSLAAWSRLPGWSQEPGVLDRWKHLGLVDVMQAPPTLDEEGRLIAGETRLWMPRDIQTQWLSRLAAMESPGALVAHARQIATTLVAAPPDVDVPHASRRWAELARHLPDVDDLDRTFDAAFADALGRDRPDEALLWVEALQRVEEVAGGAVTALHQRAIRRLALFDRQRNDRAFLAHYLPRPDQFETYRAVLAGADGVWAVHYLGGGGVGKTMLMRCLTSGTPEHYPPGFTASPTITARIDFDHVNPDYPARRPGLLIAQLAEELRLKDESGRAAEAFSLLFSKIGVLHERALAAPVDDPEGIEEILNVFASACQVLTASQSARIVLVLDTCEELARLGPDGRLPDSVDRTFAIVEALHDRLSELRVVFCGRRLLAGEYADGEILTTDLPARPFLRLHRVRPFDEEEARTYLQREGVPEQLVPAILSRSGAVAAPAERQTAADAVPRFSPFSLSVYASWTTRQSDLTPSAILDDPVDHFVRIRILDRIHNSDVRTLLPPIALLGRFDEATLRACTDSRPDAVAAVLREVASQEWVDRQAGGYYFVEPELRARLTRHFEREAPGELQQARRRVLPFLRRHIEAAISPSSLDESHVGALIALLAGDLPALLDCWRLLDERVAATDSAEWGVRVFGRLLAEGGALAPGVVAPAARAAFLVTYAACVKRQHGPAATGDLWQPAWDAAAGLDARDRVGVLVRAASGGVQHACAAPVTPETAGTWLERLSEALAGVDAVAHATPVIVAAMACADAADPYPRVLASLLPLAERLATSVSDIGDDAERAVVLTTLGRLARMRHDVDTALVRFADARRLVVPATAGVAPPVGPAGKGSSPSRPSPLPGIRDRHVPLGGGLARPLEWPAGFDPATRVPLEVARGTAGLVNVEEALRVIGARSPEPQTVDGNRLASVQRQLGAALELPSTRVAVHTSPVDTAEPRAPAHRIVPPLAVTDALMMAEQGRVDDAMRTLSELASHAASMRSSVAAVAIEAARVDVAQRMRLVEAGLVTSQLHEGAALFDRERLERVRAFGLEPPPLPAAADLPTHAARHAVWRARIARDEAERRILFTWGQQVLSSPAQDGGSWDRACIALDALECSELGEQIEMAPSSGPPPEPEEWSRRHPAQPERALRLWIRSFALGLTPDGPPAVLVRRMGVRAAATVALEEGELLALRLPEQALRLLALSLTWFEDAHDVVGTWRVNATLALARVRAGVTRSALDLTALGVAHEALIAWLTELRGTAGVPTWEALSAIRHIPLPSVGVDPMWSPWMHRVVALIQWSTGGRRPEVLWAQAMGSLPLELRHWPETPPAGTGVTGAAASPDAGTVTGQAVPLPPEAEPVRLPGDAGAPMARPAPPLQSSRSGSQVSTYLLMGAALLAGVVLGLVLLAVVMQWASSSAAGAVSGVVGLLLLALLTCSGLALVGWLIWRGVREMAGADGDRPVEPWVARVTATTAQASPRIGALDVLVALSNGQREAVVDMPLRLRRADAFAGLDAMRQPPFGTELVRGYPLEPPLERVLLKVDAAASWPCWEALLWSGAVHGKRILPAVVRAVPRSAAFTRSMARATMPWQVVTVASGAGDERHAMYAWSPYLTDGTVRLEVVQPEDVRRGRPQPSAQVLHVVARPQETPHGLYLEAVGDETRVVQESLESLKSDRGTLMDASQIAHAFPAALCCFLQPPRRASLDLTPAGREVCAQLRVVGAALSQHGVPLVVVLPTLDDGTTTDILRLLARRLARFARTRRTDPYELVSRMRQIVIAHAERALPRDAAIELALQAACYAVPPVYPAPGDSSPPPS